MREFGRSLFFLQFYENQTNNLNLEMFFFAKNRNHDQEMVTKK